MKTRITIKTKLVIYIVTSSVLIFLASIGYISYRTRILAIDDATKLAQSITVENALKVQQLMSNDLSMLETMASIFSFNNQMPIEQWQDLFASMSRATVKNRGHFYGFSASWEQSYYDTSAIADQTRYFYQLKKSNNGIEESRQIKDLSSNLFQRSKTLNKTALLEPTEVKNVDGSSFYKFYISCPIQNNGNFVGYVVGDISTENFSTIVNEIHPYPSAIAYLISNDGTIVTHPDPEVIGDSLSGYAPHFEEQFHLSEVIKNGTAEVFRGQDTLGNKIIVTTAPIQVGEFYYPWGLVLVIPQKEVLIEANKTQLTSLFVALIGTLLVAIIIYFIAQQIGAELIKVVKILERLALGDTSANNILDLNRNDEIGDIANSVQVLKQNLDMTSEFANAIGQGKLETKFNPLSDDDRLGNSLINMQKSLIKAKEDEKHAQLEEEKNRWTANGLAKFGEIIRLSDTAIDKLAYNILKNLVDYLEISMGALYVAEDENDEKVYIPQAAVAYERQKVINTKIHLGEGLVGRCAFEKLTIYMSRIPDNYITIRSGLGDANPSYLLIVPLISNDEVLGVIELASFTNFENHKKAFVEKLAENIGSTLQSAKINQQTAKLLEQSKLQSEELASQEEEMRQNMEELQSTQEEARRRETEMMSIIDSINKSVFKVEYNLNGAIVNINSKYAQFLGTTIEVMIHKGISDESELLGIANHNTNAILRNCSSGQSYSATISAKINGQTKHIEEHYTPVFSAHENRPQRIIKISYVVG